MKKYIVKCEIYAGDDYLDCDYSGREHNSKENARSELRRAENDPKVFIAWIEETED